MRNPRDFFKPLAIDAPEPAREIPFKPSRMIHFLDFSNEKMVAKVPDIAPTVDILLGNLEDAVPLGRKEAARAGLIRVGREMELGRHGAVDARERARLALLPRRHHPARGRDRRQARGHHDPQGRGPLGHPLRRSPARPAGGQGGAGPADPVHACSRPPRAWPTSRRSPRLAAHPGHELRSRRPGRVAAHEDHARRRRAPRLPHDRRPRSRRSRRAPSQLPAGPVALLDRAHGRRLHRRRARCPSTAPTATSQTPRAARRSSAPPSCSAASAPGRCTRPRSRSPRRSTRPIPRRSRSPKR